MRLEGDHSKALFQIVGRVFTVVKTDVVNEVCVFDHLISYF